MHRKRSFSIDSNFFLCVRDVLKAVGLFDESLLHVCDLSTYRHGILLLFNLYDIIRFRFMTNCLCGFFICVENLVAGSNGYSRWIGGARKN